MLSNKSSDRHDFYRDTPIKINRGTANRVVFSMVPNKRFGNTCRKAKSKCSVIEPAAANKSAVPAKEAGGYDISLATDE
jgi:hypothetical protein